MSPVPDETYYWDWTRYLSWGYFDHAPMVAWLTSLAVKIAGSTVAGIKLVPAGCSLLAAVFLLLLTKRYCTAASSLLFLILLFNAAILSGIGTLLLTPDIPLIFFWSMALYLCYRALFDPFSGVWLLLGIAAGGGMLSKYMFVLFPIAFVATTLITGKFRRLFTSTGPWIALGTGLLFFSPVIIWNARHQWVSFLFQLGHGYKGKGFPRFDYFGEFIGGQIGVVTPLLFIVLVAALIHLGRKARKEPRLAYLFCFTITPLLFFMLSSLQKRVEANWPAASFMAGFVVIAWFREQCHINGRYRMQRFVTIAAFFGLALNLTLMVHIMHPLLPLPPRADTTLQMRGWEKFGKEVGTVLDRHNLKTLPLTANRYQHASLLAFHVPGQPEVHALNINSRPNHYSLLSKRASLLSTELVFVHQSDETSIQQIASAFESLVPIDTVLHDRGRAASIPYTIFRGRIAATYPFFLSRSKP